MGEPCRLDSFERLGVRSDCAVHGDATDLAGGNSPLDQFGFERARARLAVNDDGGAPPCRPDQPVGQSHIANHGGNRGHLGDDFDMDRLAVWDRGSQGNAVAVDRELHPEGRPATLGCRVHLAGVPERLSDCRRRRAVVGPPAEPFACVALGRHLPEFVVNDRHLQADTQGGVCSRDAVAIIDVAHLGNGPLDPRKPWVPA